MTLVAELDQLAAQANAQAQEAERKAREKRKEFEAIRAMRYEIAGKPGRGRPKGPRNA